MTRSAAVLLAVASACLAAPPLAAVEAAALDPCGMLGAKAIAAELGKPVAEGRKTNEAGGGKSKSRMVTCTWDVGQEGAVMLILWSWPTAKRAGDYIGQFRKVAKETSSPPLTPLAIAEESALDGASAHVRKGINTFTLTVQMPGGGAAQKQAGKQAEALAKRVAAKL